MRTTLLLAILLLAGCDNAAPPPAMPVAKPPIQLDLATLQALENLDLRDLDIDSEPELTSFFAPWRHPINPKEIVWDLLATETWHIWNYEEQCIKSAWLIFMGKPLMMIPGESSATVHFLDTAGKIYKTVRFSTGWRIDLLSASFNYDSELQGYCIDVRSADSINGEDIARQVYGVIDQRLALLWLEDSQGKILRYPCQHGVGPDQPNRTADEWEAALSSDRPMVVLEALAFLDGGGHLDLKASPEQFQIQNRPEILLIYNVLKQDSVHKKLETLSQSAIPRIRTAAERVLEVYAKKPAPYAINLNLRNLPPTLSPDYHRVSRTRVSSPFPLTIALR